MRTVKVELKTDVKAYADGLHLAAKETKALGTEVDGLTKKGMPAKLALEGMATGALAVGRDADKAGRATDAYRRDLEQLDHQIFLTRAELGSLAKAYARTADPGTLDAIKVHQKQLGDLLNVKKLLPSPAEAEQAGKTLMQRLGAGLSSATDSIGAVAGNHVGLTIGAAAGAAAAPVIANTIGTLLSAGAGAGILGVGLLAAIKHDASIAAAGSEAGKRFVNELGKVASSSLKPQIMQAIGVLDHAGSDVVDRLGAAFKRLAPELAPLISKFAQAGVGLVDRIATAAENSGPALAALGDSAVLLAGGIGDFMTAVTSGGPQAANDLRLVAGAAADLVRFLGASVEVLQFLSKWVGGPALNLLRDHYANASNAAGDFVTTNVELVSATDKTATSTRQYASAADAAAAASRGQADALSYLSTKMRAEADPVFGLIEAEKGLSEAKTAASRATRKYGSDSDQAREANRKLALAAIDLQGKAGALGNTFDGRLSPAMRQTLKAAGLTEKQISDVAGQFKRAKADGDAYAKKYGASVSLDGYRNAKGQLTGLLRDLNNFDGNWTATMITNYSQMGKPGTGGGHAEGGPIIGPGTGTSDSIPARLSNGEHVWTAREVNAAGGHSAVMQLRSAALSSARFADGGGVSRTTIVRGQAPSGSAAGGVAEIRLTFADSGNGLARIIMKEMRVNPGVAAEFRKKLGLKVGIG